MDYFIASKRSRIYAGAIDLIIVAAASILITYPLLCVLNMEVLNFENYLKQMDSSNQFYLCELGLLLFINWPYLKNGQTIGMRFMGTKVIMENGSNASMLTVTLRLVISVFSQWIIWGITLINLGLLIFHPKRRTFHDLIAGTIVVYK